MELEGVIKFRHRLAIPYVISSKESINTALLLEPEQAKNISATRIISERGLVFQAAANHVIALSLRM